jgi:hypothetical protein
MIEKGLQDSSPRVQVSRISAPTPSDCPEVQEELAYEELEERLAPGWTVYGCAKKTAGWGC